MERTVGDQKTPVTTPAVVSCFPGQAATLVAELEGFQPQYVALDWKQEQIELALEVMAADSALVVSWDGQAPTLTVMRAAGRLSREYAAAGSLPDPPPAGWPDKINLRKIKEWAGREAQKRIIMEFQTRTNISRQDLARMLGVDPKTLRSRLKETN